MNQIQSILVERIEDLVLKLNIRLSKDTEKYFGTCPVHQGSNNRSALNLTYTGDYAGCWVCNSHHCENVFKKTILGFIRGVLSSQRHRWDKYGDNEVSFPDTIRWVEKFLKINVKDIKVDIQSQLKRSYAQQVKTFVNIRDIDKPLISREDVRKRLKIPAEYCLLRGLKSDIVDDYDIGLCDTKGKEMYERVVFPIYEQLGKGVVGCVGRSVYDECKRCNLYHNPGIVCPPRDEGRSCVRFSKWRNSKGINIRDYLYNFWRAESAIKQYRTCYIVEGAIDCLKLVQAGVKNAVAVFGSGITDRQIIQLEISGAITLVVIGDNDKAGEMLKQDIKRKCERRYNLIFPKISKHDVGELTEEEIKKEVVQC